MGELTREQVVERLREQWVQGIELRNELRARGDTHMADHIDAKVRALATIIGRVERGEHGTRWENWKVRLRSPWVARRNRRARQEAARRDGYK